MFVIIFRWKLKRGSYDRFVTAWADVTRALAEQGSLGSALFEGSDGVMTAIARWPDRETRANASSEKAASARMAMQDCIEQTLDASELDERLNLWI